MKAVVIFVLTVLSVASAQITITGVHKTRYWPSDPVSDVYVLPADAELIVGPIKTTFNCYDRIYGFYADIDNNCQIFHVCVPHLDEEGNQVPFVYSFFCGNQTVYDQSLLVCVHYRDAIPCQESASYYSLNENFGKTDRPSQTPQPFSPRPPPLQPRPSPRPPTTTTPVDDSRRFKVVEVLPDGSESYVRDVPQA